MKKSTRIKSPHLLLSSLALVSVSITAQSQTNPNYVVILADDLGYGDLSCHGGKTPTPNIDKLFNQGVEFKNFMTCPVSSPTRAGFLTGLNPLRTGQGPNTDGQLSATIPTIGSVFQKSGYKTGIFGKWHNGGAPEFTPTLPHVNDYGFDRFVGFYGGGIDSYTKIHDWHPTNPTWYHDKTEIDNEFEYSTDLITNYALEFIGQNKANQFLAYVPFNSVHTPYHVKDIDLQRVPASILQTAGGKLRTWKEYYKLYNDGFYPTFNTAYAQLTGDSSIFSITGKLSEAEKQVLYSAIIINLDDKVGEIMKYLDDNNLTNNTVVLFFSDNGATPTGSCLPFRGSKHSTLEGGVHSPTVIRWPAGGMVGPKTFKPMVGFVDVLPTFMEISGISPSTIGQIDGSSFLQELNTNAQSGNREYYWLWDDHDVIRTDSWKMTRYFNSYELYNMQSDSTESKNVYANNPSIAADLLTKLEKWRTSTGIAALHLAPKLASPINAAPSKAVLKVTANCTVDATHPQQIIQFSNIGKNLLPGDYLHFDIKAETGSKTDGLLITPYCSKAIYFTAKCGVDQFGRIQINAPAPLGGAGVWEHRVIGLGNEAPMSVNKFSIIIKKTGSYTFYIDNVQIRRGDGTIVDVWSNNTNVSATNPLYTISTNGVYKLEACYDATINAVNGATFFSQSGVPATMTPGQTASVSVTMQNTGNTTWTNAGLYEIGSQNAQDNRTWGMGRVKLNASDSIAQNATKTFTFTITAPATAGTYNFQWKMLQVGVGWFGDQSVNKAIVVIDPGLVDHTDPSGTGTVTRRAEINATEAATNAFDNLTSTKWLDNAGIPSTSAPSWIQLQLPSAVVVNTLAITSGNDAPERDPADFNLQGSIDGTSWIVLGSWSAQSWLGRLEEKTLNISNNASYNYYRLNITKNSGNNAMTQLTEIKLYGPVVAGALTVTNGTGGGTYTSGTVVTITANAPPAGQVFNKWVINSGTPGITDMYNPSTALTTGTNAASVNATYINYLDACDATTGWIATTTLNTNDIKQGTGSLQYTGSVSTEFSKAFAPFNSNIPVANAALKFWYYVSDVSKFSTINQVELGSGGRSDVFEFNWTLKELVNGWNYIVLKISNAGTTGGTPNFEAINWFRIYHSKIAEVTTKVDAIEISGITSTETPPTAIISNTNNDSGFNLYPNPLSKEDKLTIHVENCEACTIKILNLNGQVVYAYNLHGGTSYNLPLNKLLKSGVYIVSLSSKKYSATQKLFIK